MILYPAIDIRNGKAVRLVQGNYDKETVFDTDPLEAAQRWQRGGAEWIHIVDLDGARDGVRSNAEVVARIRESVNCRIQLGGGLRSMEDIESVARLGVDRMVIGSAAVADPGFVEEAVSVFGDRIAVGMDARNGMLATHGWVEQSDFSAIEAAHRFADIGLKHIIFTDIGRDGKLEGPNITALMEMNQVANCDVIASGGISSLDDIERVRRIRCAGVIVGAALYHKRFTIDEALRVAGGPA